MYLSRVYSYKQSWKWCQMCKQYSFKCVIVLWCVWKIAFKYLSRRGIYLLCCYQPVVHILISQLSANWSVATLKVTFRFLVIHSFFSIFCLQCIHTYSIFISTVYSTLYIPQSKKNTSEWHTINKIYKVGRRDKFPEPRLRPNRTLVTQQSAHSSYLGLSYWPMRATVK